MFDLRKPKQWVYFCSIGMHLWKVLLVKPWLGDHRGATWDNGRVYCLLFSLCGLCVYKCVGMYVWFVVCRCTYPCVYEHVCVDMYVYRYTYTSVHVCGGQRSVLCVFLNCCLTFIDLFIHWLIDFVCVYVYVNLFCLREGLSLNVGSTDSVRHTGQQALGSLLSLLP